MFDLTPEQIKTIDAWAYDHDCPITYEGASGGKITYQFTPTSLGTVEKAVCTCGEECDVTEYDEW